MFEEFKKFAFRGNVVDLAFGLIIGVAFGAIVTSMVQDIIMPVIGAATSGLDFSNYYVALSDKVQAGLAYENAKKAGAALGYGQFITVALNFLIIAFVLFSGNPGDEQDEASGRCKSRRHSKGARDRKASVDADSSAFRGTG